MLLLNCENFCLVFAEKLRCQILAFFSVFLTRVFDRISTFLFVYHVVCQYRCCVEQDVMFFCVDTKNLTCPIVFTTGE